MSHNNLRKALADAIQQHVRHSKLDRTPTQALNTMTAALFNILGCRPLSRFHTIDEQYYINFKAPERLVDLPTINAMNQAYLALMKASPPFHDVLTDLASEFLGRGGEGLGQFMTPRDLALLAAKLAMDREMSQFRAMAERGEMIKVADLTGSGTGSLLLAQLHEIHEQAPELLPNVGLYAMDIDVDMARATAVQLIWNCLIHDIRVAGVFVWHGNAITEYHRGRPPIIVFDPDKNTPKQIVQEAA